MEVAGLFPLPPPLWSRLAEAEALAIMLRDDSPSPDTHALVGAIRLAVEHAGIPAEGHRTRVNAFLTVYREDEE